MDLECGTQIMWSRKGADGMCFVLCFFLICSRMNADVTEKTMVARGGYGFDGFGKGVCVG